MKLLAIILLLLLSLSVSGKSNASISFYKSDTIIPRFEFNFRELFKWLPLPKTTGEIKPSSTNFLYQVKKYEIKFSDWFKQSKDKGALKIIYSFVRGIIEIIGSAIAWALEFIVWILEYIIKLIQLGMFYLGNILSFRSRRSSLYI